MPSVPRYDELQVAPRALPAARQESIASPSVFDNGTASRMGAALQDTGAALGEIAGKMQDRENADKLFQAETAFKSDLIAFDTEQRSKKGAAALADGGVTVQTDKWFGENVKKHSDTLNNDLQRRLFAQGAEKMRLQTIDTMSKHQAGEARDSLTLSTKATIKGSIDRAVANANDWTIMESERADIIKRADVLATLNGGDKAGETVVRDALRSDHLTMLHKQMIQQLVVTNPAAAKSYYDKYEKEIGGSDRAEIGEFAQKASATSLGEGAATTAWDKHKPQSATDPVKLDAMESEIREQLKGNDYAIKAAISGVRERAAAYRDQRKEEGIAMEAGVNALILKGASSSQVRRSPEFLNLSVKSPEDARKVMSFLENQDYTRVARAAASEARSDAAEARKERKLHRDTIATTFEMSDPNVLMSKSRGEIINMLPVLGVTSTQALLERHDHFTKNGTALSEAKIDNDQFKVFASRAGFDSTPKNDADKEKFTELRSKVESIIGAEQQAKKRVLTRDEKGAIMQREIDNTVMQSNFFKDKKLPAIALPDEDMKNAYVEVGPKNTVVKLSEITPVFRKQAILARQRQGLDTSERQLAELWLMQTAGKPK